MLIFLHILACKKLICLTFEEGAKYVTHINNHGVKTGKRHNGRGVFNSTAFIEIPLFDKNENIMKAIEMDMYVKINKNSKASESQVILSNCRTNKSIDGVSPSVAIVYIKSLNKIVYSGMSVSGTMVAIQHDIEVIKICINISFVVIYVYTLKGLAPEFSQLGYFLPFTLYN